MSALGWTQTKDRWWTRQCDGRKLFAAAGSWFTLAQGASELARQGGTPDEARARVDELWPPDPERLASWQACQRRALTGDIERSAERLREAEGRVEAEREHLAWLRERLAAVGGEA